MEVFNYIFQNNVSCPNCLTYHIRIRVVKEGGISVSVTCANCGRPADKEDFCTEL